MKGDVDGGRGHRLLDATAGGQVQLIDKDHALRNNVEHCVMMS